MENLENLSNADLRKKCIQYGLPNVPITDSSRNVLIRKLRASMSNSVSPQRSNRRETIHVLKDASEQESLGNADNMSARGPVRRTIAGAYKREETKNLNKFVKEAKSASIPRRSVREKEELEPRNSLEKNNLIVLCESDDEEENDLVMTMAKVEKMKNEEDTRDSVSFKSSRSVSLSKSDTISTSNAQAKTVPNENTSQVYHLSRAAALTSRKRVMDSEALDSGRSNPSDKQIPSLIGSGYDDFKKNYPYDFCNTSNQNLRGSRFGNVNPNSKTTLLYNEQSDDLEYEKNYETPYLSNFARNLELLKGRSMGSLVIHERESVKSNVYFQGKRDIRIKHCTEYSVKESLRRWLIAVDRKYNLRIYVLLIAMFLILVFCYVLLFQ